jgi:hypothetical protein
MIEVRKLKPSEFVLVVPILDKVFEKSDLPDPQYADIIGAFEDGKLQGFVILERAVFIWEFFSRSQENNGNVTRKIIKYVRDFVPEKQAVAAAAKEPRFWMLFKSLGMSEMPGKLFFRNRK